MLNELVSFILPAYNAEKYISKCINSVINQTYNEWELIIINDGSHDSTDEICTSMELKDNRIHYFKTENNGVSSARNYALSKVNGAFVFFIDADDYLAPKAIEIAIEEIRKNSTDIVVMSHYEVDEESGIIKENKKIIDSEILHKPNVIDTFLLTDKIGWEVWGKLMKKSLLEGLTFKKDRRIAEDASFLFEVLKRAESISLVNSYAYYYQINYNSVMAQKFSEKNLDTIKTIDEIADSAHSMGYAAAEAFRLKYYVWLTRSFIKKTIKKDRDKFEIEMKYIRDYIAKTKLKKAYKELSHKYYLEFIMIKYFYPIYTIAVSALFKRIN